MKLPRTDNDKAALALEYFVFETVGVHTNVIEMIEYHQQSPEYMAMGFAKAKCLQGYLCTFAKDNTKNERWARYFFRQVINGLSHVHEKGFAHLDMKIDNVLLDVNDEGTSMTAMITDFGMVEQNQEGIIVPYGAVYGPPEYILHGKTPYNGEKADVFATAFILLALLARNRFGADEQCESNFYKYLA